MKRLITPENNVKLALELRRGRWLVHDISTLIPTAISLLQQQDILPKLPSENSTSCFTM